ncbi:MAG: TPM domain-containing protein [Cardiobacteriaceae bacterium]|nr:TPM domain-containing protein [Cardiobacteriaceae bacterium]
MKRFFVALIWTCFSLTIWAASVDTLRLKTPVVDDAGVLSSVMRQELDSKLRRWQQENIMQGAVVIVDSTDGVTPFDYAMRIAERWQLGSKQEDNGLLLLVAVKDRSLYILVGSGLEGVLPDVATKRIIRDDITPYFKQGDYAKGISHGLDSIIHRLQAAPEVQQEMLRADKQQLNGKANRGQIPASMMDVLIMPMFMMGVFMVIPLLRSRLRRHPIISVIFSILIGFIAFLLALPLIFCLFIVAFILMSIFTRRSHRQRDDDDDDFNIFGGGFGGGWSSGSSGGGFGSGGGDYSGGGGGFSGGGAGGSW